MPLPWVAFDFCHAPITLTLDNDPGAIMCSRVGDCVEVVLLHPHMKWIVPLCWGCGGKAIVCILRLCCVSVDFQLASLNFH